MNFWKPVLVWTSIIFVCMAISFAIASTMAAQRTTDIQAQNVAQQATRDAQATSERKAAYDKCRADINALYDKNSTPSNKNMSQSEYLQYVQTINQLRSTSLNECEAQFNR